MIDQPPGAAVGNAIRGACTNALARFREYEACAKQLESPNREDDALVKMAICGFSSYCCDLDRWGSEQLALFRAAHADEMTPDVLHSHGPNGTTYDMFWSLCFGAALGLHAIGAVRDRDELFLAQAFIAGFMFEHADAIYAAPGK